MPRMAIRYHHTRNVGYGNPAYGFSGSQKGGYLKSVGFNKVKIACVRSAHTTQVGYACCGWVGVLTFKSQTCSKLGVENFPHNLYWDLGTTKNVNNIFWSQSAQYIVLII